VLAHVSKSIGLVHGYISNLLTRICPDKHVRSQLWETVLVDELRNAYARGMEHARFLLRIERQSRPSTYNHSFNSEVQEKRLERIKALTATAGYTPSKGVERVTLESIQSVIQQTHKDILDVLTSYYKVSRKRFVDKICAQVIGNFLLEGDKSPLKIFCSELVMGLDSDQLETIAGEDGETKNQRSMLESGIRELEAAMKVLRV
jgi:hypothetical protein